MSEAANIYHAPATHYLHSRCPMQMWLHQATVLLVSWLAHGRWQFFVFDLHQWKGIAISQDLRDNNGYASLVVLTTRNKSRTLTDACRITFRELHDEIVSVCLFRCFDNLVVSRAWKAVLNVIFYRTIKEARFLRYKAKLVSEPPNIQFFHINALVPNNPSGWPIKTLNQLNDGALSTSTLW